MAEDSKKPEENTRSDLKSHDRDGLKKAADDLLKQGRKKGRANDNEASAWASEQPDESAFEYDGMSDEEAANEIADEIGALQSENTDMKDRLMRLAADMENLRRRTEREVKDAKTFAISGFARDMLTVADDLRRALDHVPQDKRESADETLKNLVDGVELTERSMHSTMERHGVKKLDPEGQKFDPNFHQAMFEVPNAEIANNTVVQVVQAGYVIGDRVLRPAMVGVSKGGPKHAPAADEGKQGQNAAGGEAGSES